jgi:hypothetical protein
MNEYKDDALVQKYQELSAHVSAQEAMLATELKPYKDGMETIKNEFLRRFNERGSTNSKTEFGTPYKSTIMNVKVVARDEFMKFCLDNWSTLGAEMMTVNAVKDPVKQFIESSSGKPPPGVEVSFIDRINMPKS